MSPVPVGQTKPRIRGIRALLPVGGTPLVPNLELTDGRALLPVGGTVGRSSDSDAQTRALLPVGGTLTNLQGHKGTRSI